MLSWESVEKSYTDAITAVFPLHRIVIFIFGFIITIGIKNQTHLSILETVANINISYFSSLSLVIKNFAIYDLFFSLSMVFAGWLSSRIILRTFLYLAARSTKLWTKINSNQPQYDFGDELKISERKEAVEWIDLITSEVKSRLKTINFNAETASGIGFGLLAAFYWGNILDLLGFLVLFVISTFLSLKSISIFISDYLGPYSVKVMLQSGQIKANIADI